MGDGEVVPEKVERWAYAGDSRVRSGWRKEKGKSTDTATQIEKFSGGRLRVDNYGRDNNTTSGMLGRQEINGKKLDTIGKVLGKEYNGIIIEVGVNDIAGGMGKRWERKLDSMEGNILEMYIRAYVEGAGTLNSGEVKGKIGAEVEKLKAEEEKLGRHLGGMEEGVVARRMRKQKRLIGEKRKLLEKIGKKYALVVGKKAKKPGNMVGRMIFVEVSPWKKGSAYWSEAKGPRTLEFNKMLRDSANALEGVFGPLGGPSAEVAETYDVMVSPEDRMALYPEYAGKKMGGGPDYLHPGVEGRKALAAKIVLGHFPGQAVNPLDLYALTARNKIKEKKPLIVARR